MIRRVERPMALARIRWRGPEEGGRASGPPPGPSYAPTIVFAMGQDIEVSPDWPAGAEQFSALLEFLPGTSDREVVAKIEFFAPDLVEDRVQPGTELLIMEGCRVVGEAVITRRLMSDRP